MTHHNIAAKDRWTLNIIRSKARKKTIAIKIEDNIVSIYAPAHTPQTHIDKLLAARATWIEKKCAEQAARPKPIAHTYENGDAFLFCGTSYELDIHPTYKAHIELIDDKLCIKPPAKHNPLTIRRKIETWYRAQAAEILHKRTHQHAARIGVQPHSITVKYYKSRWGACAQNGALFYNWRIIMAPLFIIDYIIIHELCHMLEHNHTARFWQHVAKFYPAHKQAQAWLTQNSARLKWA